MNLYWVIIYPLNAKFPFKSWDEASKLYELANVYHPYEVTMMYPHN